MPVTTKQRQQPEREVTSRDLALQYAKKLPKPRDAREISEKWSEYDFPTHFTKKKTQSIAYKEGKGK